MKKIDICRIIYENVQKRKIGSFDIGYHTKEELNPDETSKNLDFQIRTYQTRFENMYFNIIAYDYETKKDYDLGYLYIKDNGGEIGATHGWIAYTIIREGQILTNKIFEGVEI